MATRAGVPECSTSPRADRSNARSILARPVTGYWGATTPIRASIASRWATTASTSSRARAAAVSSRSDSARWRSRIASAVRWPKSASKIAASASRRPVRRPRWRSASDTIDDDRHGAEVEAEQALDGRGHGGPDLRRQGPERLSWPGHDSQPDEDPVVANPDVHRRAPQPVAPGGAAVAHADDARNLEGRQADELGDHPFSDRQVRSAHVATSSVGLGSG